jgi:hypothetical protein
MDASEENPGGPKNEGRQPNVPGQWPREAPKPRTRQTAPMGASRDGLGIENSRFSVQPNPSSPNCHFAPIQRPFPKEVKALFLRLFCGFEAARRAFRLWIAPPVNLHGFFEAFEVFTRRRKYFPKLWPIFVLPTPDLVVKLIIHQDLLRLRLL